jgi:histidyl-tRNA synthetase
MSRFGYIPLDLPIIEDANLFLIKAGDQIINRLFTFERHGREFALRPEFTAAAAYRYTTGENTGSVARWQFSGPVFVDDPNDISGDYQQLNVGAELIGMKGQVAEAEIMAMSVQGLVKHGLDDWQLVIGHTGLIRQILGNFDLDMRTQRFLLHHFFALQHTVNETLALFDNHYLSSRTAPLPHTYSESSGSSDVYQITMGGRTSEEINYRLTQKRKRVLERDHVVAALNLLKQWREVSGTPETVFPVLESMIAPADNASRILLSEWRMAIDLLGAYDIPAKRLVIKPGLARSWEYYTGIVFELNSADVHIGGGGRYDELARLLGGKQDTPAVGFAYYVNGLLPLFPDATLHDETPLMISFTDNAAYFAMRWAHQFHQRDIATQLAFSNETPIASSLIVQNDSRVLFRGTLYTFEQIDNLIADLK